MFAWIWGNKKKEAARTNKPVEKHRKKPKEKFWREHISNYDIASEFDVECDCECDDHDCFFDEDCDECDCHDDE